MQRSGLQELNHRLKSYPVQAKILCLHDRACPNPSLEAGQRGSQIVSEQSELPATTPNRIIPVPRGAEPPSITKIQVHTIPYSVRKAASNI